MMIKKVLDLFSYKGSDRKYSKPYVSEGFVCVTNGHVFLKVPLIEGFEASDDAPQVSRVVENMFFQPEQWFPCPQIPEIKGITCYVCNGRGYAYTCPECSGDGRVYLCTDYNDYGEDDCKTCDGHGTVSREEIKEIIEFRKHVKMEEQQCGACDGSGVEYAKDKTIEVGPALFSDRYLSWLNLLPNCEIGPIGESKAARIRFDGGEGVIMPMRK